MTQILGILEIGGSATESSLRRLAMLDGVLGKACQTAQ